MEVFWGANLVGMSVLPLDASKKKKNTLFKLTILLCKTHVSYHFMLHTILKYGFHNNYFQ